MADEDPQHIAKLRAWPCCMCKALPPNEAHHRTGAGMGLRAHDHEAMPLCRRCHHDFHALSGPFKGWGRREVREWQEEMVEKFRPKEPTQEVM